MRQKPNAARRGGPAMRALTLCSAAATVAATTLVPARPAAAFGGEDPLRGNPWWHQKISRDALVQCGFSHVPEGQYKEHDTKAENEHAAEAIAWHADYIDSYLYNPLWWAKGGVPRLKASLSAGPELAKLHFDDLFSSDQVHRMYRHYTSGTVAGLIWAADHGDVPAAYNVIGVSLHAIQDFYSHSNWVDAPARRTTTYFDTPAAQKATLTLFTGAYEEEEHLGIKHHGKLAPICSLLNQPGVREIMDVLTSGISPISNLPIAQQYKDCKNGVTVQPYIPKVSNDGTLGPKAPEGFVYLAPGGIALDTSWSAPIGTYERGITDATPEQMFETAKSRATLASVQWLQKLEHVMTTAEGGKYATFWSKVKNSKAEEKDRFEQFESFQKMPYTFLSAGTYPPKQTVPGAYKNEEVYLRLRIKTARDNGAGTDADIRLLADGQPVLDAHGHPVVLDYMPRENPVLAYNDFEAGDDDVYVAGPFSTLPRKITLKNDAAGGGEVLSALGRSFGRIFTEKLPNLALSIIAGNADRIGGNKQVWLPEDLATVSARPRAYTIDVNGGDEGHYQVTGMIKRTAESPGDGPEDWAEYQVSVDTLVCVKESKNDRGSNSDEPFVMAALSTLPGGVQSFITSPFGDVDDGESNPINRTFTARVPKKYGVLVLPVNIMESDNESPADRQRLLNEWVTGITQDEERKRTERGFLTALGTSVASAWKVEAVQVWAWTRGGRSVRVGQVAGVDKGFYVTDKWVGAREGVDIPLNAGGLKNTGVLVDDLVNGYGPGAGQDPGQQTPPDTQSPAPGGHRPPPPGVPGGQIPGQNVDLSRLAGKWKTNIGSVITIRPEGRMVNATGATADSYNTNYPRQAETFYLELQPDGSVEGLWTNHGKAPGDPNREGRARITFSPDGNSFTGQVTPSSGFAPFAYSGTRLVEGGTGTGTTPGAGNGNTGVVPPGTGSSPLGGGFTQIDKEFDVRLDSVRRVRAEEVEVVLTAKNASGNRTGFSHTSLKMLAVGAGDGAQFKPDGNVYLPTGTPAQPLPSNPWLDRDGTVQVRYRFQSVPESIKALQTLKVWGYDKTVAEFDLSGYPLNAPAAAGNGAAPMMSLKFYDFTIDKMQRDARTGEWQMALSIRNSYAARLGVTAGVFNVTLLDADGISIRNDGNLYRASVEGMEPVPGTLWIEPNESVRVRVHFADSKTFLPTQFRIYDGLTKTAPIPAGMLGGQ